MQNKTVKIIFRKSKRVTLRPLLEKDTMLLMKWINDPKISQYLNTYLPMMEGDQRDFIERVRKQKPNSVVVMIVVEGRPIGTMGIHDIDYRQRHAKTGALIGEKAYWGKGFGGEAKMLLLEFAFNVLNLRKVYSDVIGYNERSYKYSIKCGYKEECRLKEYFFSKGKYWDKIFLSVCRKDWEPLWQVFEKEHKGYLKI